MQSERRLAAHICSSLIDHLSSRRQNLFRHAARQRDRHWDPTPKYHVDPTFHLDTAASDILQYQHLCADKSQGYGTYVMIPSDDAIIRVHEATHMNKPGASNLGETHSHLHGVIKRLEPLDRRRQLRRMSPTAQIATMQQYVPGRDAIHA